MAVVNPTKTRNVANSEPDEYSWEYRADVADGANGDWVKCPNGVRGVSVDLVVPGGSAGHIEHTNEDVQASDPSTGIDWDLGVVSGTTSDYARPAGAFRAVSDSGAISVRMKFQ